MKCITIALAFAVSMLTAGSTEAGFILSFGSGTSSPSLSPSPIVLLENTSNQEINVFMNWDGVGSNAFQGIALFMSLGDGTGAGLEPVFSGTPTSNTVIATIFQDGVGGEDFIFDSSGLAISGSSPYHDGVNIFPQYSSASATVTSGTVSTSGSALVAKLLVDTTGFSSGTFEINVTDDILGAAYYLDADGDISGFSAIAVNNSFSISAVPEPTSMALVGLAGGGICAVHRRKRSRRRATAIVSA